MQTQFQLKYFVESVVRRERKRHEKLSTINMLHKCCFFLRFYFDLAHAMDVLELFTCYFSILETNKQKNFYRSHFNRFFAFTHFLSSTQAHPYCTLLAYNLFAVNTHAPKVWNILMGIFNNHFTIEISICWHQF